MLVETEQANLGAVGSEMVAEWVKEYASPMPKYGQRNINDRFECRFSHMGKSPGVYWINNEVC